MRIGRSAAWQSARTIANHRDRLTGPPDDDASTRHVRRLRLGNEVVRIDVRRTRETVRSITIASDTTESLSPAAVGHVIELYSPQQPQLFRTPAITEAESTGYARCGFEVVSVLRLLTHDLERLDAFPSGPASTARARASSIDACAEIDELAFGPVLSFDRLDLIAALDATTRSRLRVVPDPDAPDRRSAGVAGFAITGRAGNRGYLQRVAVDPSAQGRGLATALVIDALRWCRSRRVTKVVVNTGTDNHRALSLYRRLGFVDTPLDLLLMERRV